MKNNKLKSLFTQRKYRYGTMATLLTVGVIILVILVQIIQSVGTALCVKSDKRINHTSTKRRNKK